MYTDRLDVHKSHTIDPIYQQYVVSGALVYVGYYLAAYSLPSLVRVG